jgi:hypothetical protein
MRFARPKAEIASRWEIISICPSWVYVTTTECGCESSACLEFPSGRLEIRDGARSKSIDRPEKLISFSASVGSASEPVIKGCS